MQRQQRAQALSTLKTALTRQFGEQAREVVETHVDQHLGGGKGQIGREHLDTLEKAIMSTMRQQRGSTKSLQGSAKSLQLSKSAPFLNSTAGSSQGGAIAPLPPATPVLATQLKLPIGTSNPGSSLVRAASSGGLSNTGLKAKKPIRPAPYGLSITGANEFADESARSGVKLQARYPVPLPPKLKPMDHWDLIVAFDSQKYKQEEYDMHVRGNYARQRAFKKVLDDQSLEIQEGRDNDAKGLDEERLLMLAQVEENKKYAQEEEALIHRKRDEQSKVNESMMGEIYKYRDKEAYRKRKEEEEVTAWLAQEKAQKEEDDRIQKIEYARKCAAAKKSLEENRKMREDAKRAEEENEKRLMKLRDQIADENEAKKQKAFQDRKDHLDRVEKTLGAQVAGRDAQDAADLEAKIKQIQEESNRKSMEDAKRRQDNHNAKVKDMVETRQRQIADKHRDDGVQLAEEKELMKVYKKQCEDGVEEERLKAENKRKARGAQDEELIAKVRENAGIHPHHVMMTPRNRQTELGYNKIIFEQMMKEDFRPSDVTSTLTKKLGKPGFGHHPEGKLCPMPTIPRYTGEIHPLELENPDF